MKPLARRVFRALPEPLSDSIQYFRNGATSATSFGSAWLAFAGRRERHCLLVYDLAVSPPSYGDFLLFCLIARLYQLLGSHTNIVVIDDGRLRQDFVSLGEETVSHFRPRIDEYPRIAALVSLPGMHTFQRMSFTEFQSWRSMLIGQGGNYPSQKKQDSRTVAYNQTWPVLEYVLRHSPASFRSRFALDKEQAGNVDLELSPGEYIVVGVRAASFFPDGRDICKEELLQQVELITRHFPGTAIYVTSDDEGTNAAREWLDGSESVRFTQDFCRGFAAHSAMCLGARCFVQLRGGGLTVAPMWSNIPWFLSAGYSNEATRWVLRGHASGCGWHPPVGHAASVWLAAGTHWQDSLRNFLDVVSTES